MNILDNTPDPFPVKQTPPPILKYFAYDHLPLPLQDVSKPFCELAKAMASRSSGPETSAGLRKLLEAKDCFVRAILHEKIPIGATVE